MVKQKKMKVKVCGMKHRYNIQELIDLDINFMGFIFYDKSPRYISEYYGDLDFGNIQKVGVFVNSEKEFITSKIEEFGLDYIQLHGSESPGFCLKFKEKNTKIIKVFSIDNDFDFSVCSDYLNVVDIFLFDAKGKDPGGNGVIFNWEKLNEYVFDKRFLLSGGIGLEHIEKLKKIHHPQLLGVDVNSGFESGPGVKNVELIKKFINELQG